MAAADDGMNDARFTLAAVGAVVEPAPVPVPSMAPDWSLTRPAAPAACPLAFACAHWV
jgi:hypothetical protein